MLWSPLNSHGNQLFAYYTSIYVCGVHFDDLCITTMWYPPFSMCGVCTLTTVTVESAEFGSVLKQCIYPAGWQLNLDKGSGLPLHHYLITQHQSTKLQFLFAKISFLAGIVYNMIDKIYWAFLSNKWGGGGGEGLDMWISNYSQEINWAIMIFALDQVYEDLVWV